MPLPLVGGHEGAGVVERVGSDVTHVQIGDHVLLSYSHCQKCAPCKREMIAFCTEAVSLNFGGCREDGTKSFTLESGQQVSSHFFGQSSFAQKSIVRGVSVVKVDKDVPLDLLCGLGCGMQTGAGTILNVLDPKPGAAVAVFGVGAVGLSGIMAANLTAATKIIAIDILDSKLELARQLGATHTINSTKVDVVSEIMRLTNGFGVDGAFDATGNLQVIQNMLASGAPNSKVASVGATTHGATIEIEPLKWLHRGVNYVGVHMGASDKSKVSTSRLYISSKITNMCAQFIPLLIEYWRSGRFPVDKLVKTYPYHQMQRVTTDLRAGVCVKAVLLWP